jgi:hypothetical protein
MPHYGRNAYFNIGVSTVSTINGSVPAVGKGWQLLFF